MLQVIEAFQILSDTESRRNYDEARRYQSDQYAQSLMQYDISKARQKAEEYPRDWNHFEAWSNALTNMGMALAKGTAAVLGRYIAGFVLCVIGCIVASALGMPDSGNNGAYACIGLFTVLFVGLVIWALRHPAAGPKPAQTPMAAEYVSEKLMVRCNACCQQLQVDPRESRFVSGVLIANANSVSIRHIFSRQTS